MCCRTDEPEQWSMAELKEQIELRRQSQTRFKNIVANLEREITEYRKLIRTFEKRNNVKSKQA